ncbi:rhamnosyltransferase [Flavobacterium cutihirudinis]|uniref:Rhamnosyltransferase n=1 Tax=Flavobacterium cutihirudinis TaxID=1265740 RepID=A0A3D9FM92_9FLAO|nr:glycosyltransferase [Flavobacterium cutihirudinis]RED19601.1 rhamnosyltransferase [Flavobacterium cutihirudinis]
MLAAVVILYNPINSISEIVGSYIENVDMVYLIDNSVDVNQNLAKELNKSKFRYLANGDNLGIAKALNIGCEMALNDGFRWVLTMDQDSNFLHFNKKDVISFIEANENSKIALYYPTYLIGETEYDKFLVEDNEPIVVMTSGNIIDLNIYTLVNGFDEKLFIDYVDTDYCLKLKTSGFKIFHLSNFKLQHELGNSRYINFFNKKALITNHSHVRRYYITRNRFYVMSRYRKKSKIFFNSEMKVFVNELMKILFFESNKFLKIKSIFKGYVDFRSKKYGKLSN